MARLEWRDIEQILLLPEVQDLINEHGERIADECGEGYVYRPPDRNLHRDRGIVVTDTIRARHDNAKNMTLIRALGVSRGA